MNGINEMPSNQVSLSNPKAEIYVPDGDLADDIRRILELTPARVVYTHNLAGKHDTHIAVTAAVLKAIRSLPPAKRPEKLIGCEVWRDLDWLPDDKKLVMDVSAQPELATRINGVFKSQISGGKRYDLAVDGRRRANATFLDSHAVDECERACFGMDSTPLIMNDDLSPTEFVLNLTRKFEESVREKAGKFF